MSFAAGQRVLVNGGVVATIEFYDEALNVIRWVTETPSGQRDVTTAHVSQTRLERLDPEQPVEVELTFDDVPPPTLTKQVKE